MPPLALADEVGLELMYQVGVQTAADLGDAHKESPSQPVLEALVKEQGRRGRRNRKGFYDYPEEGGKRLWAELGAHFPPSANQPSVDDLVQRFLYVQAIETARCVDEGVLLANEDADVGAVMGWGFAPWTGGPLSYIDEVGLADFVADADRLAASLGERFEPPPLLRSMAAEGGRFYPS